MKSVFRALAVVVALAVAAVAVVLDGCLMVCQAPTNAAVRAQSTTEHACHRTGAADPLQSLRHKSTPCSHNHNQAGSLVSAAAIDSSPLKAAHAPVALVTSASTLADALGSLGSWSTKSPPVPGSTSSFALPLRI
jgi:hypothetical protein